jgi:hypothetical protein
MIHSSGKQQYEHNGIEINKSIVVEDFDQWTARIPSVLELPLDLREYQNRAVWIEGPSEDAWSRQYELFHHKRKVKHSEEYCPATLRHDKATSLDIKQDPERMIANWLILFGQEIILDNYIFSNARNGDCRKG